MHGCRQRNMSGAIRKSRVSARLRPVVVSDSCRTSSRRGVLVEPSRCRTHRISSTRRSDYDADLTPPTRKYLPRLHNHHPAAINAYDARFRDISLAPRRPIFRIRDRGNIDAMAMLDSNYSQSSSNYHRKISAESSRRSNTQASAYTVDASSMALTGFHFSTPGAEGPAWWV